MSPAPRECTLELDRADPLPAARIVEQLAGHVPRHLPAGFGLAGVWESRLEPEGGLAIWTDAECREVTVRVYRGTAGEVDPAGPRVGEWTLVDDSPGCASAAPGETRCVSYAAESGADVLAVQTVGLERAEADAVVRSIPT
jgi:hypothetical protein